MKKIGKNTILSLVLIVAFVFMLACGSPVGTNGEDGINDDDAERILEKATIVDIYDPNRPDYGFDYESNYVKPAPPELPDPNRKFTVTLPSSAGITFADGSFTAELGEGDELPEISSVVSKDVVGWYNVDDATSFWSQSPYSLRDRSDNNSLGAGEVSSFVMPNKNITIAPFFVSAELRPLIPASQNIDTNSELATRVGTKFYETDIGTQIGGEFTYSGGIYSGTPSASLSGKGYFRMVTSCAPANTTGTGAIGVGMHTFHYWFKNLGDETMEFTVYQGHNGTTIYAGANTVKITLAPNATWSGTVTIDIPTINANALTFLVFQTDHTVNNANFAMVMSKTPTNDVK